MGKVIRLHPCLCPGEEMSVKNMFDNIIKENNPRHAFVIGWDNIRGRATFHSTTGDNTVIIFRLQEFMHRFYNGEYDGDQN